MWWTLLQAAVAIAVGWTCISLGLNDKPMLNAVYSGMAAIAVTWLVGRAIDAYRYGPPSWRQVKNEILTFIFPNRPKDRP